MGLEIEAKIKVESLESMAERLKAVGARFVAERVQHDVHFRDAAGMLKKNRCGLRIRTETTDGNAVSILTFKGPRQGGAYKTREEIETQIADGRAMTDIFNRLGYQTYVTVSKTRCLWELDGCEVCLDNVPPLGCFVEVEGPDEQTIKKVLSRLHLADRPHISKGYAAMMAKLKRD
ncbi:MAG TPA: class IV adenylate cyclase [Phycisphaerales bacterium]|nr:class IV adenylate cyclase [Phycisphaerales bacterium]